MVSVDVKHHVYFRPQSEGFPGNVATNQPTTSSSPFPCRSMPLSLMASVDVKPHVYLLTSLWTQIQGHEG